MELGRQAASRESGVRICVQGAMFEDNGGRIDVSENCDIHGLFHQAFLCIASLLNAVHQSSLAIW